MKTNHSWGSDFADWEERGFAPPAPRAVKLATILRHYISGSTLIESGTYLAETTAAMAQVAPRVYSIEPKPEFVIQARASLAASNHVEIIEGLSEIELPALLARIDAPAVSFWLDGHWSAGNTFLGPKECPLLDELSAIDALLPRLQRVSIAIDDVRCFTQQEAGYPGLDYLVRWAGERGLRWIIEHDIFIAKSSHLDWIPSAG